MKLRILLFTCFSILIISCEKETALEKYYNQPGNFSGSIYEALDSLGTYTYFLLGVDSTELKNQLNNTLVTVIAPNDKAFEAYFAKHGYKDLSSIPKDILEDLISHHVITWPHAPGSFQYEPNWFKRQTNMAQRIVLKYDQKTETEIEVVQEPKYLQFYFPEMLSEYQATANDYFLLTGTDLSPKTGFNIYDVPVEIISPYGNGWVYFVDQVVEPVQNLDDWLLNSSEYSLLNTMFNRFSLYYIPNANMGVTNNFFPAKLNNLYASNRMYKIDMELCNETVAGAVQSDKAFAITLKAESNFTVLAPKNTYLESFIDTYMKDFPDFKESLSFTDKTSVENLHLDIIVRAIIKPYMFVNQSIFPSQLSSNEGITGFDGTNLKFSGQDISEYSILSNGYGYGLNTFEVPRTFQSVLRPAFTSPSFKFFTRAIEMAGVFSFLNNKDADFTLFLPTDEAFIKNGFLLLDVATFNSNYNSGRPIEVKDGLEELVVFCTDTTNGKLPIQYTLQQLFDLVFNHLVEAPVTLSSQKQFVANATKNYVGATLDSAWSGGNITNIYGLPQEGVPNITDIIPTSFTDNGRVYVINDLIKKPLLSVGQMIKVMPQFSRFKDLCENANLYLDENGTLDTYGNSPAVFIPTNDAINQAILDGLVPSDELALQGFLKYHFMNRTIFTTETINETVQTMCKDEELSSEFKIVYKYAEVIGTYENLTAKGTNNTSFQNVIEGDNSNIICTDGIIHQIDGVLY